MSKKNLLLASFTIALSACGQNVPVSILPTPTEISSVTTALPTQSVIAIKSSPSVLSAHKMTTVIPTVNTLSATSTPVSTVATPSPAASPKRTVPAKTFTDPKHRFSFEYPENWLVEESFENTFHIMSLETKVQGDEDRHYISEKAKEGVHIDGPFGEPEISISYIPSIETWAKENFSAGSIKTLEEAFNVLLELADLGPITLSNIQGRIVLTQPWYMHSKQQYISVALPFGKGMYLLEFNKANLFSELTAEDLLVLHSFNLTSTH